MTDDKQYTPGPWRVGQGGPNKCPTIGKDGLLIAMLAFDKERKPDLAVANATLIAAAPGLLEALEYLLEADVYADAEGPVKIKTSDTAYGEEAVDKAKKAIAKAKGQDQ